jgi:DNA-binding transcriptional MerR regulator
MSPTERQPGTLISQARHRGRRRRRYTLAAVAVVALPAALAAGLALDGTRHRSSHGRTDRQSRQEAIAQEAAAAASQQEAIARHLARQSHQEVVAREAAAAASQQEAIARHLARQAAIARHRALKAEQRG